MAWVGKSLRRKEDDRLIRGNGLFADDDQGEGMLHLYILRSPYAHARIRGINTAAAESFPGVACVLTGDDVKEQCDPYMQLGPEPCDKIVDFPLATDKAVFQGEPVAVVAADTAAIAMDAGQLIEVDYDMLDAVVDAEQALEDKIILHEGAGSNRTFNSLFEYGDVDKAFEDAAHVVKIDRLHFHRFASSPVETNACVAEWTRRCEFSLQQFLYRFCRATARAGFALADREDSGPYIRHWRQFRYQDLELRLHGAGRARIQKM